MVFGRDYYWCDNGCGKGITVIVRPVSAYGREKRLAIYQCETCGQKYRRNPLKSSRFKPVFVKVS